MRTITKSHKGILLLACAVLLQEAQKLTELFLETD
jgi:hypothetical protein